MALTKITGEGVGAVDSLDVTGTGGQVTVDANGHITSKQSLDAITAGGRIIGATNRGTVAQIDLGQTAASADGGYIRFLTCDSGSTNPTERMRLLSGGGLTFNGDTAAANALDDYEEGTWTPADGSGAGLTFNSVVGTYTKIGNQVFVVCELAFPTTSNTADMNISGLPFTATDSHRFAGSMTYTNSTLAGSAQILNVTTTSIAFRENGTSTVVDNNDMSGKVARFTMTYRAV